MNRLLADTLSFLNGLFAVVIILGAALVGYVGTAGVQGGLLGLVIGAIVGFLVAGGICGLIAFLALIESHLRRIADGRGAETKSANGRREPNF